MNHQKENVTANNNGGSVRKSGYHPSHGSDGKKNELKEQGFYKTKAWRRLRLLALQRDHYTCQLQLSEKCTRVATEVHHIKSTADHPELALELSNLTCACWNCHEMTKPRGRARPTPPEVRIIAIKNDSDFE